MCPGTELTMGTGGGMSTVGKILHNDDGTGNYRLGVVVFRKFRLVVKRTPGPSFETVLPSRCTLSLTIRGAPGERIYQTYTAYVSFSRSLIRYSILEVSNHDTFHPKCSTREPPNLLLYS